MKITWLGHSAFRIETGNSVVMVDPFLSGNPKFEGDPLEAAAGATHIALTHGHDDHIGDTVAIAEGTGAQLIACFEICQYLAGKGLNDFEPANMGGTIYTEDFDVTFVRADHSSATLADGGITYLGNPCGLVFRPKDGPTVYHMGDTDIFADMALVNELYKPDVGIVPIGDRFTMNPRSAALACRRYFDFSTVLPCHYMTFPLLEQSADGFVAAMGDRGDRVKALDIGGSVTV
ncbi:metal-dependent hydrolase [Kaustia mangrovi]|uniref:UPF0173 metal-dependent hydrolase HW532_02000 n=1 Tax=Kaustia mangrovi TaxID=2593653 RepID=A0A7S8C1F1_9HYPH|nr:metal-dependent hydrolase [Kaustia mangrovi]QPC41604.1 metal-dependent hydrolase [Kaustia mangrovi]